MVIASAIDNKLQYACLKYNYNYALVKFFPWARTADACVPSTHILSTRSDQCAGVTGLCRAHLFSMWPFDWRPQKSHDKIAGNALISAS